MAASPNSQTAILKAVPLAPRPAVPADEPTPPKLKIHEQNQ